MDDWSVFARRLADQAAPARSRWHPVVAAVPRHVFVPNWWRAAGPAPGPYGSATWQPAYGRADEGAWMAAAYADRSLVTRVAAEHADHARPGEVVAGAPTSSSTLPGLLVQLYRHAELEPGNEVLDVGTGSGYGAALLATRCGGRRVTSVDVDSYLVEAAAERLDQAELHCRLFTVDATGPLPGAFDRIIASVSVRPVPKSWLAALRPGGRLVTTIAGTALLLVADATPDGGAQGRIVWDRAGFMTARTGPDYPAETVEAIERAYTAAGEVAAPGRYPVVNVMDSWELWSMLSILAPGVEHDFRQDDDGARTAVMVHSDGSWARASSPTPDGPAYVHQGGGRRLWDHLDDLRTRWLTEGSLPVYGARAKVTPDGEIHLRRGGWQAAIS